MLIFFFLNRDVDWSADFVYSTVDNSAKNSSVSASKDKNAAIVSQLIRYLYSVILFFYYCR